MFPLIRSRLRRYWPALLIEGLGVFVAVLLLTLGPVLATTTRDISLRRQLESASTLGATLRLSVRQVPPVPDYTQIDGEARSLLRTVLGDSLGLLIPAAESRALFPWVGDILVTDRQFRLLAYDDSPDSLLAYGQLVSGSWPENQPAGLNTLEVVVSQAMAREYDLDAGDMLPVSLSNNAEAPERTIRVAGILAANDSGARYWMSPFGPLSARSAGVIRSEHTLLLAPDHFYQTVEAWFPRANITMSWQASLNAAEVTAADAQDLILAVRLLEALAADNDPVFRLETELPATVNTFLSQGNVTNGPLFVLLLFIALLGFVYTLLASTLSLQLRHRELALWHSRGASPGQLLRFRLVEATLIVSAAFLLAPLVAWLVVQLFLRFGLLATVTQPGWSAAFPPLAWAGALAGAITGFAILVIPLRPLLDQGIATQDSGQWRPAGTRWWQRLYLDGVAVASGALLVWRLRDPNVVAAVAQQFENQIDWLLVLGPLLLVAGLVAISLRIFPLATELGARLTTRGPLLPPVLAWWQVSRRTQQGAWIITLLSLAMALGVFSTALNRTLSHNNRDRAVFAAGTGLRLQTVAETEVDLGASPLWRGGGRIAVGGPIGIPVEVMAIEPDSFFSHVEWRPDFAGVDPAAIQSQLVDYEPSDFRPPPVATEGRPQTAQMWLWVPEEEVVEIIHGIIVEVRFFDNQGRPLTVRLLPDEAGPDAAGWTRFQGAMPQLPDNRYPLSTESIWYRTDHIFWLPPHESMTFDELAVIDETGQKQVLYDFEEVTSDNWRAVTDGLMVFPITDRAYHGSSSLATSISFQSSVVGIWYGFLRHTPAMPMPVIATTTLMEATGIELGDEVQVAVQTGGATGWIDTTLLITQVVDYFPTALSDDNGTLIVDANLLLPYLNANSHNVSVTNEWLIPPEARPAAQSLLPAANQIWDAAAIQQLLDAQALGLGLRSVASIGYWLATILTLAGIGTAFYFGARQQQASYGVLRAIGLSSRQLFATLLLEQVILILIGMLLGTILGILLARLTLVSLAPVLGGLGLLPPFQVFLDLAAIGQVYLLLLPALALVLGGGVWLLHRQQLHRLIRVGDIE